MTLRPLNLNQALAFDRLEEFVRQEEESGAELVKGSDFERALALLITRRAIVEAWPRSVKGLIAKSTTRVAKRRYGRMSRMTKRRAL
jgi:hypothetical protein